MEPLQIYNPVDPSTFSISLGETYVRRILYGDSSSGVMHDDPLCHSWARGGKPRTDVGASHALVDSGYILGYADYLFGGGSSGFPNNQQG